MISTTGFPSTSTFGVIPRPGRGGAAILMRAILQARSATQRRVWVADSFAGLPLPDLKKYPQDAWLSTHYPELAVSMEQVQENFRR